MAASSFEYSCVRYDAPLPIPQQAKSALSIKVTSLSLVLAVSEHPFSSDYTLAQPKGKRCRCANTDSPTLLHLSAIPLDKGCHQTTYALHSPSMKKRYDFASDNTSGICPEAWNAMHDANAGFLASYGDDDYTLRATDLFRQVFETDCDVYFVFNGTAANSLALASMCQSYHSVITHEAAHIEADECGAPQFFSNGVKLLTLPGRDGKLELAGIENRIISRTDIHYPKPKVVSITLPTERGALYTPGEIAAISDLAKRYGLRIHVDGARFANAVAASGASAAELSWKSGVDVLCCGGTKIGMGVGEAVVFFDHSISSEFAYRCKQAGQLASKMRFLAAPWVNMLKNGAWTKHAAQANACARMLGEKIGDISGVRLMHPVQTNAVFAELTDATHAKLTAQGWHYYRFFGGGARFMCSWATSFADVNALAADIALAVKS